MRLDAHQHFWKFDVIEYPWIKADWPIRRDFLPPDLHPILGKSGFGGSIAVQARQTLAETQWLLDLAERYSFIKGVIGWVNLRSKRVGDELRQFAQRPKFVGVRNVVQDEPDDGFMLQPDFMRGIGRLAEFNLTYDILIFPRQLPAAIELAKRFPSQPFILDHMAKPNIKTGTLSPWREQIIELGKCPNVMCKVSGMITEANWNAWKHEDFEPYLDAVFEAFGADRIMYGSDWPVCLLSGTYEDAFGVVAKRLGRMADLEREAVLGVNAERFYLKRQNNR